MCEPILFRWLGVAGIELQVGERTLLIDPFVTRPPRRRMWSGRVQPDAALVAAHLPRADVVLVTHAHWDHLLDVPAVACRTGADVYGSPNCCRLLSALGVPHGGIHGIAAGNRLDLTPFAIEVLPAVHTTILRRSVLTGPLAPTLHPPLRLRDYRMDADFSFSVAAVGHTLLVWSSESVEGAVSADVLFVKPFGARAFYAKLLDAVRPRMLIPIHWDDFFRPLSKPLRPILRPPTQSRRPLRRVDLDGFRRLIGELAPGVEMFVPELFRAYDLCERMA
jgi:L-ascorbate metabolism protein UlaG (beta-lactamase superfamily)